MAIKINKQATRLDKTEGKSMFVLGVFEFYKIIKESFLSGRMPMSKGHNVN